MGGEAEKEKEKEKKRKRQLSSKHDITDKERNALVCIPINVECPKDQRV